VGLQSTRKETGFDLECTKETFMEAKKRFAEASTLGSKEKLVEEIEEKDPSMITTFLETCMKLLHDSKVVKGLHELINRCAGKDSDTGGLCIVRNLGNNKARTRREMRLTVQTGEYEMDQFILDLGSDVNVLPKQTWERMGIPVL